MNFMDSFQGKMEKIIPVMEKFSDNKYIKALSSGMVRTMPVLIGTAFFSIIANFPIPAYQEWLAGIGMTENLNAVVGAGINLLALYIVFLVGYTFAEINNVKGPLNAGVLSLAAFIVFIPQTVTVLNDAGEAAGTANALSYDYFGAEGIAVAMIVGLIFGKLYTILVEKKIILKMPESVPPMVSGSLEPVFIGVICIGAAFMIKSVIAYTAFENVFNLITTIITKPFMSVGTLVPILVAVYTFINLIWFFGVHPSPIVGCIIPVAIMAASANTEAMTAGGELPYLLWCLVFYSVSIGGNGNTLALALDMLLFSKSQRYKTMAKMSFVPCLFNINEPMMFGLPVILNPFLFIPFVLSPSVSAAAAWLMSSLHIVSKIDFMISVSMPWTTPHSVTAFFAGGITYSIYILVLILINAVLYFPFYIAMDRKELEQEKAAEMEAGHAVL